MSCRWHQNNAEDDLPSSSLSAKGVEREGSRAGLGRVRRAGAGPRPGGVGVHILSALGGLSVRSIYTHSKTWVRWQVLSMEDVRVISTQICTFPRVGRGHY